MAYISASGQSAAFEHFQGLLKKGTRWCAGPAVSRGKVGCGRLSRNHATVCPGCGGPTRPAALERCVGTLPGFQIGEPPPRTMDADLMETIDYVFSGLPRADGARILSHVEIRALQRTYNLDLAEVEFIVDLTGAAVDGNNRGVGAGDRYMKDKPRPMSPRRRKR